MSLYEDRFEKGIPQPTPVHLGDEPLHLGLGRFIRSVSQLEKHLHITMMCGIEITTLTYLICAYNSLALSSLKPFFITLL